ncbi:MAG TPA: M28 family peptidase [Chitinophagaceae bacterium]|nr:M28 family peptidase [Chitinophagaceae bacterium]
MKRYPVLLFVLITTFAQAQKLKKEDKEIITNLQQHITFLANDKLEGRRTGTAGEQAAAEYISQQMKAAGLQPKGKDNYLQPFEINEGKKIDATTFCMINNFQLAVNKEFFPLVYSANLSMEALPSIGLPEISMPWFWNIAELVEENKANPHFDIDNAIKEKAAEVKKKGATGLFIYNTSTADDGIKFNGKDRSEPLSIPIIYFTKEASKKYFADDAATLDMKLKVDIKPQIRKGKNVIGYIDNGAATTVVLGAHYDHLGYGEDGNSLLPNTAGQIHNGADDNASGTAAIIELARMLVPSKLKRNNYLFIAFSGEELGLYGSKYFTENPTVSLSNINYMINMDMVGRLNDASPVVTIGGYGTSPIWSSTFSLSGKNALYKGPLVYRFDSSGTGPSDHTSFYRKDIPVLFYFTGLHTDYHKPTDDFDKINYTGEMHIVKHIFSLINAEDKQGGKLAFTKTREAQTSSTASFSVTMGIMPDYTFGGAGVRVDGVSENRPAQKAGLKTGDVITKLGDYPVGGMDNYMQALNKFKKGDKTTVYYNRNNEQLSATIEF